MPFDLQHARPLLQDCDLPKLFVEELGWEPCRQRLALRIGESDYAFTALAEKRGFTAWICESPDGGQPDRAIRLKLDRKLSETSFEHLIVFVPGDRTSQSWTWVRREPGKPLAARTHEYRRGQTGDSLLQKLQALYVSLEEEEAGELSTVAVAGRARAAFDIEKVTKAFYRDFDTHRKALLGFIEGIGEVADREWYASVMLNRLMFVYFIQRKGFLDGDRDYLRNRLVRCQREKGQDNFYTFYRYFLLRLFHEGFGKKRSERAPDLEKLLGEIPYLNGGLFDVHELEKPERYGRTIQIPDEAFERIFDYFDRYQWHLDERPLRNDNEINPDVLGYIFEKYINQKQMGAYYTKEDITEYIGKNTIIPFLLDAARAKCSVAFEGSVGVPPASRITSGQDARAPVPGCTSVWGLLSENPDRYIYPAVRHGVDLPLPPEIAVGLEGSAGVPPASVASGQDAHAPFFNPFDEVDVSRHKLPHWNQSDCYCFVTWRLDDAMPHDKLAEWEEERDAWRQRHPEPWDAETAQDYHRRFSDRLDAWLDAGHGSCVLRDAALREIVADALRHFHGERYTLAAYVVMPNHVHVLLKLKPQHALADILHSWKSFTAKAINKALCRSGTLWQAEYWDRLIRNERHLAASLGYIRDNPQKARLGKDAFTLWVDPVAYGSAGILPASQACCGQDARAPVAAAAVVSQEGSAGVPLGGQDARAPVGFASSDAHGSAGVPPAGASLRERRKEWNKPAPGEYALPTEIWREVVSRRQRCEEIRKKLARGEVREINDLITLNLDIRQFAQDAIENCEGPDLLAAFWQAISGITILDPTGGSGAFIFAALNILDPLYEACLDRMEGFLAEWDGSAGVSPASPNACGQDARAPVRAPLRRHPNYHKRFSEVLARVEAHPNRRYFVLKSIILNNLYAVDIMEEAVEICKLRLFLKLAAQVEPDPARDNLSIEPLPDIDFNIRAGNTLVGYATADEVRKAFTQFANETAGVDGKRSTQGRLLLGEEADEFAAFNVRCADVQQAFDTFRHCQTDGDGSIPVEHKRKLRERLAALDDELNRHLASEYGIERSAGVPPASAKKCGQDARAPVTAYAKWLKSHQPFHWFIQFYGILNRGGFDVIIGNPPYVEYSKVRNTYTVQPFYTTLPCGNLYTLVLERCYPLANNSGWLSFISPLSLVCTSRTDEVRALVGRFPTWISNYDMRPGSLFEGVAQRLSIIVTQNHKTEDKKVFSGGYRRWMSNERSHLIALTSYAPLEIAMGIGAFPKIACSIEQSIMSKIVGKPLAHFVSETSSKVIYVHRIVRYFVKALKFIPIFVDACGARGRSEDYKAFRFETAEHEQITAMLNSTLFYWFWRSHCDGFHCGYNDVYSMPYTPMSSPTYARALKQLLARLMRHLQHESEERTITTKSGKIKYQEFYPAKAKSILDEIDTLLARHYGFTDEELDFIINYDIKYRMGRDAGEE